jgi:ubiquinone/menaquinone biosynthesis C-methylase UbiE
VSLIEADARRLDGAALVEAMRRPPVIDAIICTLGLTVLPDWQTVFARTFALLRPGGQYVVLDVHAERRVPQTALVELVARADVSRRVWEPLAAASDDFTLRRLPGSPHVHGGTLLLASGRRPPA